MAKFDQSTVIHRADKPRITHFSARSSESLKNWDFAEEAAHSFNLQAAVEIESGLPNKLDI